MEEKTKICNKECEKKHSEEWSLSAELAKSNKRMFITLITVIALWFATIAGFVWYINQYDCVNETITVDTQSGGDANYIGNDGNIYNGSDSGAEAEKN